MILVTLFIIPIILVGLVFKHPPPACCDEAALAMPLPRHLGRGISRCSGTRTPKCRVCPGEQVFSPLHPNVNKTGAYGRFNPVIPRFPQPPYHPKGCRTSILQFVRRLRPQIVSRLWTCKVAQRQLGATPRIPTWRCSHASLLRSTSARN